MSPTLLRDKVALVTGGAHGTGAAIVTALADAGARVALTYHHSEGEARLLTAQIRQRGGEAIALRTDARSPETCARAVTRTLELWGQIDILVNQAAVTICKPFDEIELREFEQAMAINVQAVFLTSQLAARRMPSGGRIIHISGAHQPPGHGGALCAMSRAALSALTRSMAQDLAPQGITVNHLVPDPLPAPNRDAQSTAQAIAELALWLASPAAGAITGSQLTMAGEA
ncbi:SDR family oxidoreductase [Edwardsiella piscicida]|uniref:SDR family NAD(P)-dependent oxidoreductase n=1 Tax=Edwardsiella piscicida TaxID=1263550 RepID=UPI000D522064|nr:SDR family oxidoreductase [Edwardsiella piscicida]EKS7813197.1 SDR family oxidoreductase [Edwardsiella piscicida]ELM3723544.1 SDR family oxidoreductase [Edwardsiella piscicida]UCQ20104.1 SDR family oxidoreductase [Edwardsiella piscicida]